MIRITLEIGAWIQILFWLDSDILLLHGLLRREPKLYATDYSPR